MAHVSQHAEDLNSSTWQQSQQQRESVSSILKFIETETFFNSDADTLNVQFVWAPATNPTALPTIKPTLHQDIDLYTSGISSTPLVQTRYETFANQTGTPPAAADQVNAMQDLEITQASTDEAGHPGVAMDLPFFEITPNTIEGLSHTSISMIDSTQVHVEPQPQIAIDLSHLFVPQLDPLWSTLSGWGEIDVFNALDKAVSQPLSYVTANTTAPDYLKTMGFDKAWANGYMGQGVVVADIDTGLDLNNIDLIKRLHISSDSWNFLNNSVDIQDDNGHGSMTALEIGASATLGDGLAGGASGSELMVLKAMNALGQGNTQLIGEAIHYAVDHGASVINLSLGSNAVNLDIQNAMQYAYEKGTIVVAAAGNDGDASVDFPAAYAKLFPNVIAVGASQSNGQHDVLASFSNQAGSAQMYNFVDALGTDIRGYTLDGNLAAWSGTSMAAPLVAAEAAILKSANPHLSAFEIVQDILHSCHSLEEILTNVTASKIATEAAPSLHVSSASVTQATDLDSYVGACYLHDSLTYVPTEQHC